MYKSFTRHHKESYIVQLQDHQITDFYEKIQELNYNELFLFDFQDLSQKFNFSYKTLRKIFIDNINKNNYIEKLMIHLVIDLNRSKDELEACEIFGLIKSTNREHLKDIDSLIENEKFKIKFKQLNLEESKDPKKGNFHKLTRLFLIYFEIIFCIGFFIFLFSTINENCNSFVLGITF
jgi:hypothetical protein